MNAFEMKHVNQTFGTGSAEVQVLHDVNFSAQPGTLSLIMGPSGSGKSTFLTIAGGLLTPTSGTVTVNGTDYHDRSKKERDALRLDEIGFILQTYHLLPYLTVADQLKLVTKVKPTGNLEPEALKQVLATLGIQDLLHKYPGELSGGQQQRVAIARALYPDPAIILADEPTAALDGERVKVVAQLLKTLAVQHQKAVVVVTHDARLVEAADQLYHMQDGVLTKAS
ncbi:ABC transporter ATP-binding protein [Loigolactobacillus bifermentans]|uniref:Putative hemin import ATP-binding protein HrtA n=1 Tax=Loigolactobacillus bifermentans DSM 20003 TaxID=1423726 RepID=A0A0R1H297_9LACO|nr:ABC transporter ATP-binding protein [Loigolactobacillus bifermentans]KRK40624.1 ABC superfamily ATP binding cassette transporter, ABC protein [Loigolactobacillus bifermentans DSM 20003]QGG60700.1 ATP-binding cassette domain-containing protein [Loigolactobacillus bifermentans]